MQTLSIIINTCRNEKDHVSLLFKSLELNLHDLSREILVFVDSDNQDTTGFLIEKKKIFPNLKIIKNKKPLPIGYQTNINILFDLATSDIVSYLQSDMVISKNYDLSILDNIKENTILSSTRIEPPLHPQSPEKITMDFGKTPNEFKFEEFCKFAQQIKEKKITNYFFAPFSCYRKLWTDIGGHDSIFRRSREDSDILWRFLLKGYKIEQTWDALVYHFSCTSSRGKNWWINNQEVKLRLELQSQADNIELRKFVRKWGKFGHPIFLIDDDYRKYNISAIISGCAEESHAIVLFNLFHLFDKIYVEDPVSRNRVRSLFPNVHVPANKLFSISDDVWESNKHIFRCLNFEDIFVDDFGKIDSETIIKFDIKNFLSSDKTRKAVELIQDIIKNSLNDGDSGEFEVDGIDVDVKCLKNRIYDNVVVSNPKIDNNTFEIL